MKPVFHAQIAQVTGAPNVITGNSNGRDWTMTEVPVQLTVNGSTIQTIIKTGNQQKAQELISGWSGEVVEDNHQGRISYKVATKYDKEQAGYAQQAQPAYTPPAQPAPTQPAAAPAQPAAAKPVNGYTLEEYEALFTHAAKFVVELAVPDAWKESLISTYFIGATQRSLRAPRSSSMNDPMKAKLIEEVTAVLQEAQVEEAVANKCITDDALIDWWTEANADKFGFVSRVRNELAQ